MTPAQQAQFIRAALTRLGITQAALALSLGVSERTVRRWVSGTQEVPKPVMLALKIIFEGGVASGQNVR